MSSPPVEALVASVPQSLSNVRAASELAARLTKAVQRERPAVALVRAAQSATARLLAFVARHQTNDDTAVDYSRRAAAALESVLREQPFDSLEPAVMEAYADTCEMLSDKDGLHADAGHLQRTIAAEQALLKHSSAFALSEWSLYVDTLVRYADCLQRPAFATHPQARATARRSAAQAAALATATLEHHVGPRALRCALGEDLAFGAVACLSAHLGTAHPGSPAAPLLESLLGDVGEGSSLAASSSLSSSAAGDSVASRSSRRRSSGHRSRKRLLAQDAALESSGVTDPADAVMASRLLRGAATALQLLGEAGGTSADISSEARRLADWFRGGSGAGASYSASQEAVDAAASAEARGSFWRLAIAFSALSAKLALAGSNSAIAAANLATEGAARAAADEATLLRSPGAAKAMPASCLLDATWPVLGLDAATVHAAPHSAAMGSSTHTVSAVGAFSAGLSSCGSSVSSGSASPGRGAALEDEQLPASALDILRDSAVSHNQWSSATAAAALGALRHVACVRSAARQGCAPGDAWDSARLSALAALAALDEEAAACQRRCRAAIAAEKRQSEAVSETVAGAARVQPPSLPPSATSAAPTRASSGMRSLSEGSMPLRDGAAPEAAAATGTTAADSAAAAATGGTCDDESAAAAPLGRHRSCLSTASFHCGSATSVASSSSRATRLRRVRFSVETLEEVASHEAPGAAVVPSWHARLRRGLNQAVLEAETGRAAARAAGLKSLALSMAPPAAAILHAPA
ncbi:hypothetical protein FNF27_01123 [Cafeteria roenbergensis]|uniref:Uncharacterized protein n=1 Tax=Cafeteria roenbergensis TaxID=33653 RepID=A0A5A8EHK9_CAFRO|nr:hypothetical protein FNF27_01123 [Cafeteria roenbergensis]